MWFQENFIIIYYIRRVFAYKNELPSFQNTYDLDISFNFILTKDTGFKLIWVRWRSQHMKHYQRKLVSTLEKQQERRHEEPHPHTSAENGQEWLAALIFPG